MEIEKNFETIMNGLSGHWILSDLALPPLSHAQILVIDQPDRKTAIKLPQQMEAL
jgi:hypothetical protein